MAESDLPPPRISDADAQRTPVVRLPAFLCPEEIAEIDAFHAATSHECGHLAKASCAVTGAALWTTTYLSTDRRFNARFPALLSACSPRRGQPTSHVSEILRPVWTSYHEL